MSHGFVRIISRPPGGAPEEIRDEWIGLTLPTIGRHEGPLGDVMTHAKVDRSSGFRVDWFEAMEILGGKSPEARSWWESNCSPVTLVFSSECLEVLCG